LVATYGGNPSYKGSVSATDTVTVTQAATTTTVSANPTSVQSGANVTLTALVTTTSLGLAPSGTVQFYNAGTPISGTVTYTPANASASAYASLTATLTTAFTASASITAQYSGDTNYTGSTSAAFTVTVTGAPNFSLSANPTALTISAPGGSQTSTITITPTGGFTGTVNFTCAVPSAMTGGACSFSQSSLVTSGSTTLTVTTTAPSHVVPRAPEPRVPPSFHLRVGWRWLLAGLLALVMLMSLMAARRRPLTLAFAATLLMLGIWVACGGGGGGGETTPPPAPIVTLSTTTLTFSAQNVGTASTPQSVKVNNTGNAALSVSGITIGGTNPGDFAQTNTCGSSVAVGSFCEIAVTFTPAASSMRSASLAIADNASGSPQSVTLNGTGAAPAASLSTTSLNFGSQSLGTTSAPQSVTLSNPGNATLNISNIAIGGADPGDFNQTNNCNSSVAANANCAINVTFTPKANGPRSASLAITDNASNSPQSVSLSGGAAGTPPGSYTVTVTATSGSISQTQNVQVTVHGP